MNTLEDITDKELRVTKLIIKRVTPGWCQSLTKMVAKAKEIDRDRNITIQIAINMHAE